MGEVDDFDRICFVIMPFDTREVGDPAIARVAEGKGKLEPKRTDADKLSVSITQDMHEYITHSRLAFEDISASLTAAPDDASVAVRGPISPTEDKPATVLAQPPANHEGMIP